MERGCSFDTFLKHFDLLFLGKDLGSLLRHVFENPLLVHGLNRVSQWGSLLLVCLILRENELARFA